MINTLNQEYRDMMADGKSQVESLIALASKYPYRLVLPTQVMIIILNFTIS